MFAPVYEQASQTHPDIVLRQGRHRSRTAPGRRRRIPSIPTLMAFRDGILVFSQPGALPATALEQVIAASAT